MTAVAAVSAGENSPLLIALGRASPPEAPTVLVKPPYPTHGRPGGASLPEIDLKGPNSKVRERQLDLSPGL